MIATGSIYRRCRPLNRFGKSLYCLVVAAEAKKELSDVVIESRAILVDVLETSPGNLDGLIILPAHEVRLCQSGIPARFGRGFRDDVGPKTSVVSPHLIAHDGSYCKRHNKHGTHLWDRDSETRS